MSKPIALITGDWHVRRVDRVWYRRDTLFGDTEYGLNQVCDIAERYDVPNLLLLGDLFDQKMQMSQAIWYMRRALDRFQHQNRKVYYVQGQHELSNPPILQAMHPWPQWLHERKITLEDGPTMYGLDYLPPIAVEAGLRAVPKVDILATHQVWRDFMGAERGDAWLNWVRAPYIFTGDFHTTLLETRGKQTVVSPGPLCMQSISEPHRKFVYILNDDMSFEQVALGCRGYFEARIHDQEQLDQFIETWNRHPARMPQQGVPHNISTNIIRVWYRQDVPDAKARIEARIGQEAHLFLKVIPVEDETVSVEAEQRIKAVMHGGLEGCIRTFYGDDDAVCKDAIRLARSRDISAELLNIFKERVYGSDSIGKGPLPKENQRECQSAS